jgi:hypothetical protein
MAVLNPTFPLTGNETTCRAYWLATDSATNPPLTVAPYVFVKTGGVVNYLADNASVTLGQIYLAKDSSASAFTGKLWEVTQSGTCGTIPLLTDGQPQLGYEVTNGTAKLKVRYPTSWTLALGSFDTFYRSYQYWTGMDSQIGPTYNHRPQVFYIENTYAGTPTSGDAYLPQGATFPYAPYGSPNNYMKHPRQFVSVPPTTYPPTSYSAGAAWQARSAGSNYHAQADGAPGTLGFFRGLTIGHSHTNLTVSYYLDLGQRTFYDCTVKCASNANAYGGGVNTEEYYGAGIMGGHFIRCTLQQTKSVNADGGPGPLLCLYSGTAYTTVVEGGTVSRTLNTHTNGVVVSNAGGGGISGGSVPTGRMRILGVDFSAQSGSILTFVNQYLDYSGSGPGTPSILQADAEAIRLFGCIGGFPTSLALPATLSWCSNGATAINTLRPSTFAPANVTTDYDRQLVRNTTYYRSGGAGDAANANFSLQVVGHLAPAYLPAFYFHNAKVDESLRVTVEVLWAGGANRLSTEDIWLEVVYPDDATTFRSGFKRSYDEYDRRAMIYDASPDTLPTSSETWNGGLANAVKQYAFVEFHAKRAGTIVVWVGYRATPYLLNLVARPTYYLCPLLTVAAAP